MKKILLVSLLSIIAFADFIGLTPAQVQKKIDTNVVIIDIRTPSEWKDLGVIPTSKKVMFFDPRGNYNIQAWMDKFSKIVKNKNQPFVLVCRSGNRTSNVGKFLSEQLKYKNVFHIQNGIKSWIKENRKVEK